MTQAGGLLDRLFGSHVVAACLDDRARVQGMLDFEAALARAEAKTGVVPEAAAAPIAAKCRAELFDLAALAVAAAPVGNPAIPLVKRLTELVAADSAEAARYVHWGATSQDVMDTGLVLQLRRALTRIKADLDRLIEALSALALRHRDTPETAAPGCSMRCRSPSDSRRRAGSMPWAATARGWPRSKGDSTCCNSAAPPAHWRRWATKGWRWRASSPGSSISSCRRCPGTASATVWPNWRRS
jgi:hypothetical protein